MKAWLPSRLPLCLLLLSLANMISPLKPLVARTEPIDWASRRRDPASRLVWNPPGQVQVPIFLYHHIDDSQPPARYFVSPASFAEQIDLLHRWGYRPISLGELCLALESGADLPLRPFILTFDDSYRDVYENAFPILQAQLFPAVDYVIVSKVGLAGYLSVDDLAQLQAAGWEIGDHSSTHVDIRFLGEELQAEVAGSRHELEDLLGRPVTSFSYPYGLATPNNEWFVQKSGFNTAVGLGGHFVHTPKTRYYLSRIEVDGQGDLQAFIGLLPWSGPLSHRQLLSDLDP